MNLVDTTYGNGFNPDLAEEGMRGSITEDSDGDGKKETLVVHEGTAIDEMGEPLRDDGSDWHVYVREETGETTFLLLDYIVESLKVGVGQADSSGRHPIILQRGTEEYMNVYRSDYLGPNNVRTIELVEGKYVAMKGQRGQK